MRPIYYDPWRFGILNLGYELARLFWKIWKEYHPDSTTKSIVILGCAGSGKTHLWRKLQGERYDESDRATHLEKVKSFVLGQNRNGIVHVKETDDISGSDGFIEKYDKLIEDDTFVYFLINLTRLEEEKQDNRSRLYKIGTIIQNKKNVKLNIIGTHAIGYNINEKAARKAILEKVFSRNIKTIKMPNNIRIIDTKDDACIKKLRNEILKSIEYDE